jgi:hypothetical protein
MKHNTAVNTLCTMVFVFGVLVGILMHGNIHLHDLLNVLLAGVLFSAIRLTQFRLLIKKVLVKLNVTK